MMRQEVTVSRVLEGGMAEVTLRRRSACAGDCGHCGGCGEQAQTITVRAYNRIGAHEGDRVIVESAGRTVLSAALLVYLAPLVLFFAGWAVGSAVGLPGWAAACCSLGFLLGIVPAVCYNRYLTRKKPVQYTITARSQA